LISEFRANDPKTVAIFQKYEIHIMPLVNPDGYEYTFNTVRLWRKVNINKNFKQALKNI
jgi:murein tripeptide amidase MpaA